jgi:ABC-type molybdate transport system substrate-binding protein
MRTTLLAVALTLAGVLVLTGCPGQRAPEELASPDPTLPSEQPIAEGSGEGLGRVLTAVPCGVAGPYGDICEIMKTTDPAIDMQADVANTMVLNRKLVDGKGSCDAYLAMGNVEVEALEKVGKVARAVPVAGMGLGLIVAKGNPLGIKSIADLANDNVKAVAIARPNSSVGFCAEQALKNAGVWSAVEAKLARPDAPSELKSFVMKGKADAAIIYNTCLVEVHTPGQQRQEEGQGVSTKLQDVGLIDQQLYEPFSLQVVVPTDAQNPAGAEAFIRACLSEAGQKIFADWSYIPLKPDAEAGKPEA